MKVALLGFECESSNKGCEALTYSFLKILSDISFEGEIHIYTYGNLGQIKNHFTNLEFYLHKINLRKKIKTMSREMKNYDVAFDVTFGDGFSDIYGFKWNCITNFIKEIAQHNSKRFILLPQTYGPYKNIIAKLWARRIIKRADYVFSRDTISFEIVKKIKKSQCCFSTIDMAFALPYDKNKYNILKNKKHIGINVSSLLWNNDISNNKFDFCLKYKKFIYDLLVFLLNNDYNIHLISHVIDDDLNKIDENDYKICKEIFEEFNDERIILAPRFQNPIDAKSYIANMDMFLGSRMHATIASISSLVPTIALSYSRKFEGLYKALNYKYLFSGKTTTNDEAMQYICSCLKNIEEIKQNLETTHKIIDEEIQNLKKVLKKELYKNNEN